MSHFLYRITTPKGAYIGVSKNPNKRLRSHRNDPLSAVYGLPVELETLAFGPRDYIYDLEIRAIAAFNTRWPNGLNRAIGGLGGRDPLPSSVAKMIAANTGREVSAETRAKQSAVNKTSPLVMAAVARSAAARKGRHHSPEHKAKIGAGQLGRKLSSEAIAKRQNSRAINYMLGLNKY